jgi:hypothetical protein
MLDRHDRGAFTAPSPLSLTQSSTLSLACIGEAVEAATIRSYVVQFRVAIFWTISGSIQRRRRGSPLIAGISQQCNVPTLLMKQVTFDL